MIDYVYSKNVEEILLGLHNTSVCKIAIPKHLTYLMDLTGPQFNDSYFYWFTILCLTFNLFNYPL